MLAEGVASDGPMDVATRASAKPSFGSRRSILASRVIHRVIYYRVSSVFFLTDTSVCQQRAAGFYRGSIRHLQAVAAHQNCNVCLGERRTSRRRVGMSAKCQERNSHPARRSPMSQPKLRKSSSAIGREAYFTRLLAFIGMVLGWAAAWPETSFSWCWR